MKKIMRKETVIGLTMLIALFILFFGINYLKGVNIFHDANYYYVTYTNVAGLKESAPVTVNGYKVGLVKEIKYEYDNPGHISVELSLDRELKVPVDTKAIIASDLLGTATVELIMGTSQDYHSVGNHLIGENAPGMMSGITDDVLPAVASLMPRIDSLLVAVTYLATDPALASSLQRLDRVMANLEVSTQALSLAMKPTPGIVNNAALTMENATVIADNLQRISADLAEISATLSQAPIDSTLNNINAISTNLLTVTQSLESNNSSLGLLLNDPGLYNNLNNTAAHLDSILIDLKRQPKRYIPSIKIF